MAPRVALITGAGSGVGRAAALELGERGFTVVLTGRRRDALEETAAQAAAAAHAIPPHVIPADVGDSESVARLFAETRRQCGRLDVLFNNAGINVPATPLEDLTLEQWQSVVTVNLTGVFLCTQQAIRLMKSQQPSGGRIINNGSVSAQAPRPLSAPYTATKHGVTGLTKSTSLDGRRFGIVCGQIDIGNAATDMTSRMSGGVLQADGSLAAEPTMDVRHVARAVAYLAELPLDVNVPFITVMANGMPLVGRG